MVQAGEGSLPLHSPTLELQQAPTLGASGRAGQPASQRRRQVAALLQARGGGGWQGGSMTQRLVAEQGAAWRPTPPRTNLCPTLMLGCAPGGGG